MTLGFDDGLALPNAERIRRESGQRLQEFLVTRIDCIHQIVKVLAHILFIIHKQQTIGYMLSADFETIFESQDDVVELCVVPRELETRETFHYRLQNAEIIGLIDLLPFGTQFVKIRDG